MRVAEECKRTIIILLFGDAEFDLPTLEHLGNAAKAKAFMNALLKLGLAKLVVNPGEDTVYILM